VKVIHFIDSAGLYGAEKMLLSLCKEQIKAGIEPIILSCGEEHQTEKPLEAAAKSQHIKILPWRMTKGLNLKGTKKLLQQPELKNADIYHSHGYKFNILLGFYKGQYQQKFLTTVHGYIPSPSFSKGWLYQTLDRLMLKRADNIVFVNEVDRQRYAKANDRTTTIANGIEISNISTTSSTHNFSMVFIGRLSHEKGVDLIPLAIKEALKAHPNITLDIYGLGPLFDRLQLDIRKLELQHAINLKGYIENAEEIIKDYDLVLMPSFTEGLPIVALEAINSIRPILCTKVGGLPSLLGEDYPLFIHEIGSSTSIANAIKNYYQSEISITSAQNTKLKAKLTSNYSAKKMASNYFTAYNQALAS